MQFLRMDGIPALTLWDLVIEVFHSVTEQNTRTQERATGKLVSNRQRHPTNIDHIYQIQRILVPVLCCMSLRTMRQ